MATDLSSLGRARRVPGLEWLPPSALRVLAAVWACEREGGPVTVRRLCGVLGVALSAVSLLLRRLEDAGLVDRGPVVPQTSWPDTPWKRRNTPRRGAGRSAGTIRSRCVFAPAGDLGRAAP